MNEYQGCERICTTSYDMSAPQIWPEGASNRRKRHNEECVPASHAVCPTFHDPVCGEPSCPRQTIDPSIHTLLLDRLIIDASDGPHCC